MYIYIYIYIYLQASVSDDYMNFSTPQLGYMILIALYVLRKAQCKEQVKARNDMHIYRHLDR